MNINECLKNCGQTILIRRKIRVVGKARKVKDVGCFSRFSRSKRPLKATATCLTLIESALSYSVWHVFCLYHLHSLFSFHFHVLFYGNTPQIFLYKSLQYSSKHSEWKTSQIVFALKEWYIFEFHYFIGLWMWMRMRIKGMQKKCNNSCYTKYLFFFHFLYHNFFWLNVSLRESTVSYKIIKTYELYLK